jgi:UDP-glucose 4-epimerase
MVSGAAGFIGSRVCGALVAEGPEVFGVDDLSEGFEAQFPMTVKLIPEEVDSWNQKHPVFGFTGAMFHLVGHLIGKYNSFCPLEDLQSKNHSKVSPARLAHSAEVRKFLHFRSMSFFRIPADSEAKSLTNNLSSETSRMFLAHAPGQNLDRQIKERLSIFPPQATFERSTPVKASEERASSFSFIEYVMEIWLRSLCYYSHRHLNINVDGGTEPAVKSLVGKLKVLLPEPSITYAIITPADHQIGLADIGLLGSSTSELDYQDRDAGALY